ncbi:MAG: glycosyltransferase family 4 protein [Spirochaetales bacterium]|uniref:Glycosyltransferase family 4 protein n=1 Tax=Candidatus Thalassospirochaeta sargassi TaxID=3119039 RepID=A0AAJ1MM61_9SPIO|nr:glycosyltransferase family 4 protein [Spirochaetales bacterium]
MKIAVLSPISWRTPPRRYGPWEQVASNIAEGLVDAGHDVTLFATEDSVTSGRLESICRHPCSEDNTLDPKVWECLHIANLMEHSDEFDIIHNNFDFLPLTYSKLIKPPMLTTIHGFSSPEILPVYKKYNDNNAYVSISDADRSPELSYVATVYNGIKIDEFTFNDQGGDYLLFFGRIHPDKGTYEAIQIAQKSGLRLIISGLIQDRNYFKERVEPYLNENILFIGNSGPEKRNRLLGGALALLHPINFEEPFGLSVAEAMICGTPVIAFNKGSMPELIRHSKTGFIVESVNEAADAVTAVNTINRIECRDWAVKNFSQEKMIDSYIKIYDQIVNL